MARIESNGRVFEMPDAEFAQLLQSRNRGFASPGNHPIANHDEYSIQTDDGKITPAEIQNEIGGGFEEMDFNDGRSIVKPNTWHSHK